MAGYLNFSRKIGLISTSYNAENREQRGEPLAVRGVRQLPALPARQQRAHAAIGHALALNRAAACALAAALRRWRGGRQLEQARGVCHDLGRTRLRLDETGCGAGGVRGIPSPNPSPQLTTDWLTYG
eukprot:scaffold54100_cov65-Phaeocystis_antarctica.AAC.3